MHITETQNKTIQLNEGLYDLAMLEEMDDVEYMLEIIQTLLDESPADLSAMKEALRAGSPDVVCKKAHKLKSTAAVIQAGKLKALLESIEMSSKTGQITGDLESQVGEALHEYSRVESSLMKYVEGLK